MSLIDGTMAGVKGKRVPGRPGRFDPSEPLHMTTRRAAKTTTTNGSPSLNGSIYDDESRRGSMDDSRPFTSYSNGSQFSVKSRRVSDASLPNATPEAQTNGVYFAENNANEQDEAKPYLLSLPSPSPTRKRKRSSSPAPPSLPQQQNTTAATSFEDYEVPSYADDVDSVEVVQADELSDREVPPSQITSESAEDAAENHGDLVAPSMDATPAISGHVSPVTSDSNNSQDDMTAVKELDAALEKARAQQDEGDEPDEQYDREENDDAAEAGEDLDDAEEVDEPARSDDDGRPRRGRFGGRRRAKHHIPRVEMAMQRQSELKSAYRAIARAQKAVLAEIAQRTVDSLETEANAHLQADEYEDVRAGLDLSLEQRRGRLRAQHELNMAQLNKTLESQAEVIKATKMRQIDDLQDGFLDSLEYKILEIARAAHMHVGEQNQETEDEDDILPRPKGMGYKWKRSGKLDSVYDSRSRLSLETRRAMADMEKRFKMQKMLDTLPNEGKPEELKGFTVGNIAQREMAIERKNSRINAKTLADAAAEVERLEKLEQATRKPVIPNTDAHGLQLLGDLASRPSITGSAPISARARQKSYSHVGQTPPRPMPPHLQLHTHYGPSRIPVEMSPRTTQALNDRFDTGQAPPLTPQKAATLLTRSPEAGRKDFHLQSPPVKDNIHGFRTFPTKHASHQSESFARHPVDQRVGDRQQHFERKPDSSDARFRFGDHGREPPKLRDYSMERSSFPTFRGANQDDTVRREDAPRPPVGTPTMRGGKEDQNSGRKESSFGLFRSKPFEQQDRASEVGAIDGRGCRQISPQGMGRRTTVDSEQSPPRRWSTVTSGDFRHDSNLNDEQRRIKHQYPPKTNKAERQGASRRQFSKDSKAISGLINKSGPASANSPPTTSSPFAGSPVDRSGPPTPWQQPGPLLRSPLGPPPPSAFGQAPSLGHHASPFPGGVRDLYQHRDSFSSRPPPASIWNQASPSPLYAVPGSQHPPPPGAPSDQYSRFGGPPPGFPPPPQTPQTSAPQSAPGSSYGPQFGGQPLAPAMNQAFHPPGFRPAGPMPAFAQQAQQQQQQQQNSNNSNNSSGTSSQRRRTQSDVSFPKFQRWQPPTGGHR